MEDRNLPLAVSIPVGRYSIQGDLTLKAMRGPTELQIVPYATHLFEEPGALEQVALRARWWFEEKLIHQQAA